MPIAGRPTLPFCPVALLSFGLPLRLHAPCSDNGAVPLHLVAHPIAQDILLSLRDKQTPPDVFRQMARRISLLLTLEATRDLPQTASRVDTPVGPADGLRIGREVVVVPVLRAGLGMLEAVLELLPRARVGHIGLQRDEETAIASKYYAKFPVGLADSRVLMIDPMLATGGSAVVALDLLRELGATDLHLLCIVAAPEGIATVEAHHPDVHIYTPVVDQGLNPRKFIVPGLGDFGDRLFGT
jgi:uracil phosphoribosyltransferase